MQAQIVAFEMQKIDDYQRGLAARRVWSRGVEVPLPVFPQHDRFAADERLICGEAANPFPIFKNRIREVDTAARPELDPFACL